VLEDDAGDEAYADDVCELMGRAGRNSPEGCKGMLAGSAYSRILGHAKKT
jgi:hypothetical protein